MTEPRKCPDCSSRIAFTAVSCACGWKHPTVALQDAEAAARKEAFRKKEAELAQQQAASAAAFREARGLNSTEDCVALARNTVKRISCTGIDAGAHWRRVLANPTAGYYAKELAKSALAKIEGRPEVREPGCDDEAVPA